MSIAPSGAASINAGAPSKQPPRRSLSGPELDRRLGVSRQYRHRLVSEGRLPRPFYVTVGGRPRWYLDEVEAALAAVQPPSPEEIAARRERMRELNALSRVARRRGGVR